MDFSIPADLADLQERTRAFIRETIIPLERDGRQSAHGPSDAFRRELNGLAAEAGLLAPHVAKEYGGLGLGHVGRAIVFEEAGYSVLGPLAMNLSAPDEGNMHLLELVGTGVQKERWLAPLARGDIRSCFAMTEPPPGAGSDPAALSTLAVRDGDDFVITGRKWFITGAVGAGFVIVMAKGEDGKATMFMADMDRPGIRVERVMDTIDEGYPGGHAVLVFEGLRVPAADVLGEVGAGFRYAQVRLAPARLTHCMRWLGAARRAQDIALDYARRREAFGKALGQHEAVGFMLADNEMEIRSSRLTIWHTAWLLDQGERAGTESSIAKVMCSEAIYRVARAFRIYDGPSEVHRWSLAQKLMRHGANDRGA